VRDNARSAEDESVQEEDHSDFSYTGTYFGRLTTINARIAGINELLPLEKRLSGGGAVANPLTAEVAQPTSN